MDKRNMEIDESLLDEEDGDDISIRGRESISSLFVRAWSIGPEDVFEDQQCDNTPSSTAHMPLAKSGFPHAYYLATKILPLSKESEQTIACQLIADADLNSLHCLKLSDKPDLKCAMCLPTREHGLRKLVLVVVSHSSKMATPLGLDDQVSYLSLPAQTAQKACVDNIVAKLLELELTNKDVLILDIFSSTVLMGSDEMGMPVPAF